MIALAFEGHPASSLAVLWSSQNTTGDGYMDRHMLIHLLIALQRLTASLRVQSDDCRLQCPI